MKKRNVKLILLLELVLLIPVFLVIKLTCMGPGFGSLAWFIDFPSILGILLFAIPGLMIFGEWKNFCKAFSVGQTEYKLLELKNILEAVKTCQKLVVLAGLFEMIISFIAMMGNLSEPSTIGPNLAVMVLSGLYVVIAEYFLLPLSVNTQKAINEGMELNEEE